MKGITKVVLVLLATTVLLSSCKKEEENNPEPTNQKSFTEIIAAKGWKLTAATLNGNDIFTALDSCEKDDIYYFLIDGTYIKDEGEKKCRTTNPQFLKSTWKFIDDNTKIDVNNGEIATIIKLAETEMILSRVLSNGTLVVTYTEK